MKKLFGLISILALTFVFLNAAEAKSKKKLSHTQAKKECLKEDPGLAGKSLQQCIKQRRK